MSQPFGAVYADSYDLIYRDKDYAAESTLIESIFRTYNDTIRSVLDLGCGTGNHAFPLPATHVRSFFMNRGCHLIHDFDNPHGHSRSHYFVFQLPSPAPGGMA